MKKITTFFAVLLIALITSTMLISCGDDKKNDPTDMNDVIAGTWVYVNPSANAGNDVAQRIYTFKRGGQGGSLTTIFGDNSESTNNISTWNVDETANKIIFGIIGQSGTFYYNYRYTNGVLYLTFIDGFDYKFTKK